MQKAAAMTTLAVEYTKLYLIAELNSDEDTPVIDQHFRRDFIDRGSELVNKLNQRFGRQVADRMGYIGEAEESPAVPGSRHATCYIIVLKEVFYQTDVPSGNGFLVILGLDDAEISARWSIRVAMGL